MTTEASTPDPDAARKDVWVAFADHFLDTETRQDIPWAALAAVEGGFAVEEARRIWRNEVSPAVGANLRSVAGEWAGWDRDWLVTRCTQARQRKTNWPVSFEDRTWVAIGRCMEFLLAVAPEARKALTRDLAALAAHYFDFVPKALPLDDLEQITALRRLYVEVFLPTFRPLAWSHESADTFADRVEVALGVEPRQRGWRGWKLVAAIHKWLRRCQVALLTRLK